MPKSKFTEEQMNQRILDLRREMENIVSKCGYVIQGVGGCDDNPPFIYTFGRNDNGKEDLYIPNCHSSMSALVKECFEILDSGEYVDGKVYESKIYKLASRLDEPSKFKMSSIDPSLLTDRCLGIFNRGKKAKEVKIINVRLADNNNNFPDLPVENNEYISTAVKIWKEMIKEGASQQLIRVLVFKQIQGLKALDDNTEFKLAELKACEEYLNELQNQPQS